MVIGEKDTQGNEVTYKVVSTRENGSIGHSYSKISSNGIGFSSKRFDEESLNLRECEENNVSILRNDQRIKSIETAFKI
jgi:hypothetical protein